MKNNTSTESQMLQLLAQNQNNPQAFRELIMEFVQYYGNTNDIIDDKCKEAENNYKPASVPV